MVNRSGGVGQFGGQSAMQIAHEVLAWRIAAQPRRTQLDRGLHLFGFEVVGARLFGGLPSQQALHKAADGSVAHDVTSSPDCAAIRSARYCNTLAFATLTPI